MTPDEISIIAAAIAAEMKHPPVVLDWGALRLPEFTTGQTRPECSALAEVDAFKLLVIANVRYRGSMAQLVRTAVQKYLAEKWPQTVAELKAIAARENLTIEECLSRIADGTLKL
jgi:hypothetical protein